MERDEDRRAEALDRYWDALRGGEQPAPPAELGETEAALARHWSAPSAGAEAAQDRVWRTIRRELDARYHAKETRMPATAAVDHPRTAPIPNGRTDPRRGRPASPPGSILLRHRLGSAVSLAAAAVLVIALVGGLVAVRFGMPGSGDGRFGGIPAAQVSTEATPPADPVRFLWQTSGDPNSPLGLPVKLAVAPDGNVWVADGDHDRFQVFAPDGTYLESWGKPGSGEGQFDFTAVMSPGYPFGAIAFAPDGTFYVADPGNVRIQRFGPDRRFLAAWGSEGRGEGQFVTPIDLVVDGRGQVIVVDRDRNTGPAGAGVGAVQVFDADGRFLAAWGALGAEPGQLDQPHGIGLHPADGTLLITEQANNRVQRFSVEGELLDWWGGVGTGDGRFSHATDAAADAAGRVFVTDYSNHRVQVFDRDGRFLAAWGERGTDAGRFSYVLGVAVGPDGTVYVTDEFKRLQAFRVGDLPAPAATPAS